MPANESDGSNAGTADSVRQTLGGGEPPRILIVEDEFLIALELENRLLDAGFEVAGIAVTASEAISMAGSEAPDLAIMDIRLAGRRDGIDAAIELSPHSASALFLPRPIPILKYASEPHPPPLSDGCRNHIPPMR